MINGEKIKEIFPSMEVGFITESQIGIYFVKNQHSANIFDLEWWNAEYQESTTKNDLADGKDNNVTSKEDTISRQEAIDTIRQLYIDLATQKYVIDLLKVLPSVTPQELIHGKCNQCKYYEGVHNVQGHAPCSYHKIGGIMWNWYCSQFESEVDNGNDDR